MADTSPPEPPSEPASRILVVDDDRAVRSALKVNLSKPGYHVELAASAEEAQRRVRESAVDLVVTDVAMPAMSGMELLTWLREHHPEVEVVVMTGYGNVPDAVAAMKAGATDYIIKPVSRDELLVIVRKALASRALHAELVRLRREVQERYGLEGIIGATPVMQEVFEQIAAVADTSSRVLVQGPTGTGKELIARALHYRSRRRDGPLITVNCAALPEGLLESELFGHEKGAFTSAVRQHLGRFEQAHGGTLFLDEVGEMDPSTQVKLLRVLETGEFQRVGGRDTIRVDVRVVSATNRDLQHEVREGRFREDLFYRLNVFTIQVPALRERRDDIPLLVRHFVRAHCDQSGRPELTVTPATMERLAGYHWPGNVRELQHVIERAVILSRGQELTAVKLPEGPAPVQAPPDTVLLPDGMSLQAGLKEYERRVLIETLKASGGVQAEAARRLGISRSNLNYRVHRLGITVKDVVYE